MTYRSASLRVLAIFVLVAGSFVLATNIVDAYSARYSSVNQGGIVTPTNASKTVLVPLTVSGSFCNYCHHGRYFIDNPNVTIQYGVSVVDSSTGATIPPNGTVQAGRHVTLRFKPHVSEDIYWFATGHFLSSPYGDWVSSQSLSPSGPDAVPIEAGGSIENLCTQKNLITSPDRSGGGETSGFGSLSVNGPNKHISGLAGFSCTPLDNGNLDCVFSNPGQVDPVFVFDSTYARFFTTTGSYSTGASCGSPRNLTYKGTARKSGSSQPFVLTVPEATIVYPLNVVVPVGGAPSSPSVSASAICVADSVFTISMTSSDAENDDLRYGVDWNNDGALDQWVPSTGYSASGSSQNASRTYTSAGSKTIRVLAEDSHGLQSGWTPYTFSCAAPDSDLPGDLCPNLSGNQVTVPNGYVIGTDGSCVLSGNTGNFNSNGNAGNGNGAGNGNVTPDLSLRAIPSLVQRGGTSRIHWSATNVSSCTVSGTNGDSWSGRESPIGGETSSPIMQRVDYTLRCLDSSGAAFLRQASVNILPAWLEQ